MHLLQYWQVATLAEAANVVKTDSYRTAYVITDYTTDVAKEIENLRRTYDPATITGQSLNTQCGNIGNTVRNYDYFEI